MEKIISEDKWFPADGIVLEENALSAIKEKNNVLVVAGPGAGKTELLAQKACYLLQTNKCNNPRRILAISFKKDAAENLKERVEKRCGKEQAERFDSMTYDAFAKQLLDHFYRGLPKEYRPCKNYAVNDDKSIEFSFKKSGFVNNSGKNISKFKKYFYDQLSSVTLPLEKSKSTNITERAWKLLLNGNGVDVKSCLTFQMISRLAEYMIRTNKYIKNALRCTYSYVFLDEFQDTTEIQYCLVKTCFMNSNCNMTAVGDNKQRIMLWAGALKNIFNDFCSDFSAVEKLLLMNHRSAPKLVQLQKMMYESLRDDTKEIICSEKWNKNDGEIYLYEFNDYHDEAKVVAMSIEKKYKSGFMLNDTCILTKQKPEKYTKDLIEELKKRGIRARIENDYQDLIKEPVTKLIINVLSLIFDNKRPDSWKYLVDYLSIAYKEQIDSDYDFLIEKESKLSHILKGYREDLSSCDDIKLFEDVVNGILNFCDIGTLKSIYPQYMQEDCFKYTVEKLITLLWNEYEEVGKNWSKTLESFKGLHSVPIMTIHKSKGLEYDSVYFIGLEDSAFWNFKKQPMEDRCAFLWLYQELKVIFALLLAKIEMLVLIMYKGIEILMNFMIC
ncbi:UvrD-helicase domain-containing protein [Clostridium ljungdahlii]|uniref:UvrD-helicase domain-containing protein n=1 Tax=Clostridium ljungdahlii TaxID=1538 RepID=UPI00386F6225